MCTGEVISQPVDNDRQPHAHRRRKERPPPPAGNGVHIEQGDDAEEDDRDGRRGQEAAEDGLHGVAAIIGLAFHQIGADDGSHHANAANQQRVKDVLVMAGDERQRHAQDQAGNDGDFVRLKNVGGHTGAVAHVIADKVGDDGRIARVVFGHIVLNLAHQVGTNVGRLGIDTAAHAHKQGDQCAAEAEPQQCIRRGLAEKHKDQRATQQAQTIGEHAGDRAGAIGNAEGVLKAGARGRSHPHIPLNSHAHAQLADRKREPGAHDKRHRATNTDNQSNGLLAIARKNFQRKLGRGNDVDAQEQRYRQENDKGQNSPQLPSQIGVGSLADSLPDLYHFLGTLVFGQDLPAQE